VFCLAACCLLKKRLPPNRQGGASIDLKALCDIKFGVTTLAIFLIEFAVFIPYTYISSYAIHMGIETQTAYRLNAILNAGAILGRVLPGHVADPFGVFNTMCVTALTCTAFILGLWFNAGRDETMITSFAVLFGFWSGAAISLTPVCVGQICDTKDYGKRSGTSFFVTSFGALTGIPLAGAILQARGGAYDGLILFAGGCYGASLAAFITARCIARGCGLKVVF